MNILIVEDSKVQEILLRRILNDQGHSVRCAFEGEEALKLIQEHKPDLVISDIIMPGMNGFELCARIKNDERMEDIPVLLLTVLSDPQDIIEALRVGANGFVTKPYEEAFLVSQIDGLMRNQDLRGMESDFGIQVYFAGRTYHIGSEPRQMLDLLFATYENALQKNRELEMVNEALRLVRSQLEKQNDRLAELNEEKNRFLGMAAHDLRNPLGVIEGFTTLLLESGTAGLPELDPEDRVPMLHKIRESSRFMLRLVDDLLDISAIESGRLQLRLSSVNLGDVIRNSLTVHRITADRKGIILKAEVPEALPTVRADAVKIEQVLNNLIVNALKFSREGDAVTVAAQNGNGGLSIRVRDTGPGIAEKDQSVLFEPFRQTGVKPTAGEKGAGLGLSIVKKITDAHGARIDVESEPGKGAVFTVTFPNTMVES